ncbi:OmpA family protein [Bradyrhizobium sp. LjRoot220]|uniref:OmpA family protein n=1 Tax=Bradyrhizobium sp. LjRoot220 TaxID=3342284 RepID=UPI003ED10562
MQSDQTSFMHEDVGLLTMSDQNRIFLFLSCLLLVCSIGASTARADCAALVKQFDEAFSNRSLPQVTDLEAKIAKDGSCSEPDIRRTRLSKAKLQFDVVKGLVKKGAAQSEYEGLLVAASDLLWEAAVLIGNEKSKQRDFVEATIAYERAIELVKNPSVTTAPPDKKMIRAIFDSAAESRMLAANEEGRSGRATYVPAAKDHRDGSIGGTMSVDIRGVTPTSVPIPIAFETATARFSANGEKAAKEFLLALQQQSPAQITLVGHTDERGEADYNMRLSDERVKVVAAFLKQNGITARITTIAKGKTEPFKPTDASQFSREDIWAMNRRVEWKRQ